MRKDEVSRFEAPRGSLLIALLCAFLGWAAPWGGGAGPRIGGSVQRVPRAYLVPVVPGGTALRLAMVHDVLTERYPRHSAAWHEARVVKRRAALDRHRAAGELATPAAHAASADLAVSLDLLHRREEAETVLRDQLAWLPAPEIAKESIVPALFDESIAGGLLATRLAEDDRPRYAAYANLATVLAHAHARSALMGDTAASVHLAEARGWLERALELNPGAHFGRELWQHVALRWLESVAADPHRLRTHDLLGRAWDRTLRKIHLRPESGSWRAIPRRAGGDVDHDAERLLGQRQRTRARSGIPQLHDIDPPGVAFDRPVLALLGMWMHGGGPGPHSALALAHLMEDVGQRWLAWECHARALSLAEAFPERERAVFVAHCQERQRALVMQLAPDDPEGLQRRLTGGFAEDLAAGMAWQRGLQADEAARLEAGADVDDPALRDALRAAHPVPTSPPGDVDYRWIRSSGIGVEWIYGFFGLMAGLGIAFLRAGWSAVRAARR